MALQAGHILVFGITNTLQTYGLLQRFSVDDGVSRTVSRAPDGSVVAIQEYGEQSHLDLIYIPLLAGTASPTIGTAFTFDGVNWRIDNIEYLGVVDGFVNINVVATYYPEIGL
jgi:hypothetical protein